MKFKVTMKTPDSLHDAIASAVVDEESVKDREVNNVIKEIEQKCRRWFEYGEYLRVEVDTDAMTIKVLENR